MKKVIVTAATTAVLALAQQVNAIEFDGFLSAGFAMHDQKNSVYLDTISDDLRFDNDSKFGLQITADVSQNMQAVAQVLAAGSDENFDLDIEWAYLDWALTDSFSLRGGKVKEPVFLISDYIEVGYAYPWIRPPQEVYRNNPINTINGLEALYQADMGEMSFTFQPYLGTNTEGVPGTNGGVQFDASNFYGASIQLASRSFTFQMSFLQTDVATINISGNPALDPFAQQGDANLISAGLSWDVSNFVGYTEVVTRDISGPAMEGIFPDQDAWYVTLGYRMGNFLPHITIANSEADPLAGANQLPTTPNPGVSQDSITLGVRYEINDSAAFKFEVQSIEPDLAANSVGLFNPANSLPADFSTGDTATLISASVDVIF